MPILQLETILTSHQPFYSRKERSQEHHDYNTVVCCEWNLFLSKQRLLRANLVLSNLVLSSKAPRTMERI